ncbi:hypothetical protein Dsin_015661 [Dipteronia sinensis]|uniref:DUF8040 domain-containing protein n=1 Tax=Dipteronia sinensis TaxID=43782 RepID=A0AAE0AD01_9ROSI|nr:hypothetical protein Dsin_015661 [Dipteronia sinensis]
MDMYDKMFKGSTLVGNCVMIPSSTILLEEMVGESDHDKQTVDEENEEASQGNQDKGKKRTNDESEINEGVVGESKRKKGKLRGAVKLSKQIDHLVEGNESRCYNMFRMDKHVFVMLLNDVENNYKLKGSRNISGAEILGMFLYILGQGIGNRNAQECFQRSSETGGKALPMIIEYSYQLYVILNQNFQNSKWKTLLGICRIPTNERFLEPYKGERYHIPHFCRGEEPTGYKDIFNHAYSSLGSIIERILRYGKKGVFYVICQVILMKNK